MNAPVETKVKMSAAAAALSGLLLWAAGRYVFKGSVPDVVESWVYAIIPALITFTAGYYAKHTPRAPEVGAQIIAAIKKYGGDVAAPAEAAPPAGPAA